MKKAALLFGLVISLAVVGFGQRTITNSTLEKFQQKRLAAEREYRDNYARMGFPSPEELDRQREADMAARLQLAEQLRHARLEKERLELDRRSLDLDAMRMNNEMDASDDDSGIYGGSFYGGFGGYGGYGVSGFGNRVRHPRFGHQGPLGGFGSRNQLLPLIDRRGAYRVSPFGVIPVPNPQPPRVIFRGGGGRRH